MKNFLYKAFKYVTQSTASTLTGILILSSIVSGATYYAHAQSTLTTSYDVTNEVQMHLAVNLTPTQTTGIIIAAPKRNAANHTFATTTGGVLRIRFGAYQEDISFTGATVNSTTYQITLAGVTRQLCPNITRSYVSCGDGRSWGIGAFVELNNDARLFNLKANIDRANTFSASGAIAFVQDGSGSLAQPVYTTTTLRDHNLGSVPRVGLAACTIDTGLCYDGVGGSWVARTASTVANASETAAGKVQMITLADLIARTATGSTGAQNVLGTQWLVRNGTGTVTAGRIPQLNQNGVLDSSFFNASNSGVLMTKTGTGLTAVLATGSGQILMSDVHGTWFPYTGLPAVYRWSGTDKISPSGDTNFATTYTIGANTVLTGSTIKFAAMGTGMLISSYAEKHGLKLGSTELCRSYQWDFDSAIQRGWKIDASLSVIKTGANGLLRADCVISLPFTTGTHARQVTLSGATVAINTTTSNTINTFVYGVNSGRSWLTQLLVQFYK